MSGRFLQRADITNLEFNNSAGEKLNVEARLETVAWPDHLVFILAVRPDGEGSEWQVTSMEISLEGRDGKVQKREAWSLREASDRLDWGRLSLSVDPVAFRLAPPASPLGVEAFENPGWKSRPVEFDSLLECHRIDLNGIEPTVPAGQSKPSNDAMEQVRLVLSNATDHEQVARLLFENSNRGIRQKIGSPITGVSAVLRDKEGFPTGVSGQHGKNWHNDPKGGDFFRLFYVAGERAPHRAMRTTYHRQGPCLTEVTYSGHTGKEDTHSTVVSLARSDDLVRGIHCIRMDLIQSIDFSRFVVFQIGADSYTGEHKFSVGDKKGLAREWESLWGDNTYRTEPAKWPGKLPWASLHDAVRPESQTKGAWANRGLVLRKWKARLGGKDASPWFAERGLKIHARTSSTFDILPPSDVTRLEPGDYIEPTIEHVIVPQFADDYYGPSRSLRAAPEKHENTWRMIHREAAGNSRRVEMTKGTLERVHPDIRAGAEDDNAAFRFKGGLGYVPITITGLKSHLGCVLSLDGKPVDQSIHGNDFLQADYDSKTRRWSRTCNIRFTENQNHVIHFFPTP